MHSFALGCPWKNQETTRTRGRKRASCWVTRQFCADPRSFSLMEDGWRTRWRGGFNSPCLYFLKTKYTVCDYAPRKVTSFTNQVPRKRPSQKKEGHLIQQHTALKSRKTSQQWIHVPRIWRSSLLQTTTLLIWLPQTTSRRRFWLPNNGSMQNCCRHAVNKSQNSATGDHQDYFWTNPKRNPAASSSSARRVGNTGSNLGDSENSNGEPEGNFEEAEGTTQQGGGKTTDHHQMVPDTQQCWLGNQASLKSQPSMKLVFGSCTARSFKLQLLITNRVMQRRQLL